ncbi:protein of unknown function [Lactiplantibacillus plantarum]
MKLAHEQSIGRDLLSGASVTSGDVPVPIRFNKTNTQLVRWLRWYTGVENNTKYKNTKIK